MTGYDLSDYEKEMLKVIKHNQLLSDGNQQEINELKNAYDHSIADTDEFLKRICGYSDSDLAALKPTGFGGEMPRSRTKHLSWEDLIAEANAAIPYDIGFEDILSSEEFASALRKADEIDAKFSQITSLKGVDLAFLFVATALQCTRQYVIDPWIKAHRPTHGEADKNFEKQGPEEKATNRSPRLYRPTSQEILVNPVPFDTTFGSPDFDLKLGEKHRTKTLGHDPILGWVFGTMNILTSTLTMSDLRSFHIKTGYDRLQRPRDKIADNANIGLISKYSIDRFWKQGRQGKIDTGIAIGREAIHLASDVISKESLPIPFIPSISQEVAIELSNYGIDTASVGVEAGLAALINVLIAMVHGLFYFSDPAQCSRKLHEVRTRKVLLYSNSLAASSNVIATVITKNPNILDVGGLLVAISGLFRDIRFICKVKQDFINSEFAAHFKGIADEAERLYSDRF